MTIEEKAKAYDEALEIAKQYYYDESTRVGMTPIDIERMFPVLKESEDKRIKNFLISKMEEVGNVWKEYSAKDIIAWLEKQSEQKPESITDEWIEDYWQHKKVNNPYSYDKGEEIQFDHQGFVRFCKKYCKNPAWSEGDEEIISMLIDLVEYKEESMEAKVEFIAWLKSLKDRIGG